MSAHQTCLERSIARPRGRQGKILCPWRGLRGAGLRPKRRESHPAHQPLYALTIDPMARRPQHRRHPRRVEGLPGCEQLVDPPHQRRIVVGGQAQPIDARTGDAEQLALRAHRQVGMIPVHERMAVRALIFRTSSRKNRDRGSSGRSCHAVDLALAVGSGITAAALEGRAACSASSRRKSGSDAPDSAATDRLLSLVRAALPAQSSPSAPRQSSASSSASFLAPSVARNGAKSN